MLLSLNGRLDEYRKLLDTGFKDRGGQYAALQALDKYKFNGYSFYDSGVERQAVRLNDKQLMP